MSGVEVAGLILGAIPLLIAGLENYEDGLGKVKAFWKWEDELSHAIRKLWYHYTSYELSIRVLLASITSESELEAMLSDPSSKLWGDPDIEGRLQERLSTAYKPYIYTISEIEEALEEIAKSLNLDRAKSITKNALQAIVLANPRTSTSNQSAGFQFNKRVKFTMKKQKVKRLLEGLELSIGRLDSFNEKTEKLEPYRNNRKSHFVVPLLRIHQYATMLHSALGRMWAASAQSCFNANLLLEQRMAPSKKPKHSSGNKKWQENDGLTRFTFSIFDSQLGWTMAEVLVMEETINDVKTQSKVKIAITPPSSTSIPSIDVDHLTLPEITNLRSTLQNFQMGGCPGFWLDHTKGKLKGVYTSTHQVSPGEQKFVKLSDLIEGNRSDSHFNTLTREHSYILAVTLCSSLLQLHATPWIGNRWSKRDIAFQESASGGAPHGIPAQISHPYIAHICSAETCDDQERNGCHAAFADDSCKLLDLGIILLEIYFNRPLESFYEAVEPSGLRSELHDLGIVKYWMSREKGNLSWAFQNAISHCLRCFADPNANLHDAGFRQAFIDQVLHPLQDELTVFKCGPTKI